MRNYMKKLSLWFVMKMHRGYSVSLVPFGEGGSSTIIYSIAHGAASVEVITRGGGGGGRQSDNELQTTHHNKGKRDG